MKRSANVLSEYIALSGPRVDSIIENIERCPMRLYSIPSGLGDQVPKGRHILGLDVNPTRCNLGSDDNPARCNLGSDVNPTQCDLGLDDNPARYILGLDGNPARFNTIKKALKGRNN